MSLQPKRNPETEANLPTPEERARRAKEVADNSAITLERYHATATQLGIHTIKFNVGGDGIRIALRGVIKTRNVRVDLLCPTGYPFPLYAMQAVEEFKRGLVKPTAPNLPPDVPLVDEVVAVKEIKTDPPPRDPFSSLGPPVDVNALEGLRAPITDVGVEQPGYTAAVARQAAARATELARAAVHVDTTKAPAAGAGQRKGLGLPLCKQCEAQPVYQPGAEFCGGSCAKQFFTNAAAARKGIRVP